MNAIFVTGTAGSGKSLLTSKLVQRYQEMDTFVATVNLDPGVSNLPYAPDVDIRDFVDIDLIMENYGLGPNGSLVMASDLIATKIDQIQDQVDALNADYIIIDTPGQVELFAFRPAGSFFAANLRAENKVTVFAFDGVIIASPINFVSVSILAASVKLRLNLAQINVLTKRDIIAENLKDIMGWASSHTALESALDKERLSEYSLLSKEFARALSKTGFSPGLIAISNVTLDGIVGLSAALSRTLNQGEDG
jgi:GTPase SAR1 family protein